MSLVQSIAMGKLTKRQVWFAHEYVCDLNASRASVRAGYHCGVAHRSSRQVGSRLLSNVDIAALVQKLHQDRLDKVGVKAEDVLRELARVAMASPKGFIDDDGRLLALQDLDDQHAASIASFELATNDDGTTRLSRVKLADKIGALAQLCKHLGLLAPQQHIVVTLSADDLARCTDAQLLRVEDASSVLAEVQHELAGNISSSSTKMVRPSV